MLDKINQLRLHVSVGAILVIIMGIVLVMWPAQVVTTIAQAIGLMLLMIGLFQFFGKLLSSVNRSSGMLVGVLIAVVGFWILVNPERAASIIPVIIGVILVVHGIQNISLSFTGKGYNMPGWQLLLLGGIFNLLFGGVCIVCAFAMVQFVAQIAGFMLIYDGIASMLTVHRLVSYEKQYIDVEYREL